MSLTANINISYTGETVLNLLPAGRYVRLTMNDAWVCSTCGALNEVIHDGTGKSVETAPVHPMCRCQDITLEEVTKVDNASILEKIAEKSIRSAEKAELAKRFASAENMRDIEKIMKGILK